MSIDLDLDTPGPAVDVPRDRRGRPLIVPPEGANTDLLCVCITIL